jgi:hypothetical protein
MEMTGSADVVGAHLVGSVPLTDATAVFTEVSRILGAHLKRIPDGETGPRSNWVAWQLPLFLNDAALESSDSERDYGTGARVGLRAGRSAASMKLESLGYADAARESFDSFDQLKRGGTVPPHCRFQVCLPTPTAPIHLWVRTEDQQEVEAVYEAAMMRELDAILTVIPHDQLAIQWDTAVEFGVLEGCFPTFMKDPIAEIADRLERLGNRIPDEVELGYHLCYGDAGHQHFVQPKDMQLLVDVARNLVADLRRPLNWLHMPVPRDRHDAAYFAPASVLQLADPTELYLGLVHFSDGIAGARKRIRAAAKHVARFGVATECGFGRRAPDTVTGLLQIHRALAAPR